MFVGEETAIWLQFIFSEPIRFLPEGIDGTRPLAPQVKALAAATAQATKTKTLQSWLSVCLGFQNGSDDLREMFLVVGHAVFNIPK